VTKLAENHTKKIHIIGSVGSGKTTFARELSIKLNIPFYEIDNIVWKRAPNGDIRNTPEERDKILKEIISSDSWIVEGVHSEEWVMESFLHADVILFLKPHSSIRNYRIVKRFIRQKLRIEKSNYKPTLKIFFKMFRWNKQFEERTPSILKKLDIYNEKLTILKNYNEIIFYKEEHVNSI
jgi:adenylate kinase family enzyme